MLILATSPNHPTREESTNLKRWHLTKSLKPTAGGPHQITQLAFTWTAGSCEITEHVVRSPLSRQALTKSPTSLNLGGIRKCNQRNILSLLRLGQALTEITLVARARGHPIIRDYQSA